MSKKYQANIELHTHPFLENYQLADVVKAMDKTKINILALEALDDTIYYEVAFKAMKQFPKSQLDSAGIKLPNGKYLLNAREYNTKENFHILTVGYSLDYAHQQTEIREIIDKGLEHNALVLLDHPYADNGKTRTAGHISEKMEQDLENLCKEYSGEIALEWNGYSKPWMRWGLKIALNLLGHRTKYHNINKKVEALSKKLANQGYHLPIVTDTDVHARTKNALFAIGTSRIITDLEGDCAQDIVASMKDNIFKGDYQNTKKYVGTAHLLRHYCFPLILSKIFKRPRG